MKYWKKDKDIVMNEEKPENGFKEITEEEYATFMNILNQITELKWELKKTDYKAVKFAEGWYSEEEYAEIKSAREDIRNQIRELEERF